MPSSPSTPYWRPPRTPYLDPTGALPVSDLVSSLRPWQGIGGAVGGAVGGGEVEMLLPPITASLAEPSTEEAEEGDLWLETDLSVDTDTTPPRLSYDPPGTGVTSPVDGQVWLTAAEGGVALAGEAATLTGRSSGDTLPDGLEGYTVARLGTTADGVGFVVTYSGAAVYDGAREEWQDVPLHVFDGSEWDQISVGLPDGLAEAVENEDYGAEVAGGFYAGIIDTSQSGAILPEDEYQTPLRYALIVSPRDMTSNLRWSESSRDVQEAKTLWNGLKAQESLVAPDGDATFPAFDYCHNISDDGGTLWTGEGYGSELGDVSRWYLPSWEELSLLYWRFKPTTSSNDTSSISGDFPDDTFGNGRVQSSDPPLPPYTSNTPEQTSSAKFRSGGDEELERIGISDREHHSATWQSSSTVYTMWTNDGAPTNRDQDDARVIRPVRRVILP